MSDPTTPSALLDAPGPRPAADASRPARSPASRRTVPTASTAPVADEAPPTPDVRVLILTLWTVPAARAGTAARAEAAVQADAVVQAETTAPASADAAVPVVLADRPAPVDEADAVALVAPDDPACPAAGADPAAALPPGAPPPDPLSEALSDALSEPRIEEVLALVRACTGGDPVLCPVSDLTDVVDRLTETADAVLLLGAVDVLADAPVEDLGRSRLSTLALEELAAPDGPDRLVAALLSAQHPPRARVVVLTGTRGGLGTSTFLLHLARACTVAGARVALAVRLVGEDVTTDDLEVMARAPVVARIPHDRAVAQRVARGDDPTRGRGSARRAARAVAAELVGLVGTEWPW